MKQKRLAISNIVAAISLLAALYGNLNSLLPVFSAGTYISLWLIVISAILLTYHFFRFASNPDVRRASSILGQETVEKKYSKEIVWSSRLAITLVFISSLYGIYSNLARKKRMKLNFTTESVKFKSDTIKINFNIANNSSNKFFITSFGIIPYLENSSCSYFQKERYGLDLYFDSTMNGVAFESKQDEILPFTVNIKFSAHSCIFKAFGIYFVCNDMSGKIYYEKSDVIYLLNADDSDPLRNRIDYFPSFKSQKHINKQGNTELLYGNKQDDYYLNLAKKIYEQHAKSDTIYN